MEAVFSRWDEIVGTALAAHLRPVRVDGRALVVTVDHPAWATQARMDRARSWPDCGPRGTRRSSASRWSSSALTAAVTGCAVDRS